MSPRRAALIKVKRVYEAPSEGDGFRILVDRVWPRGLSKKAAAVDVWMWDIAPSAELRKWFGHDPDKWKQFCVRYTKELDARADKVALLKARIRAHTVTLVYAAKDIAHNNAVALKQYLETH